jgi:hypothetical protein
MYGSYFGQFTLKGAATRYNVNPWVIRDLANKLGLGQQRFGRNRVISAADLPALEIGLKALGHKIPPPPVPEEVVAGR